MHDERDPSTACGFPRPSTGARGAGVGRAIAERAAARRATRSSRLDRDFRPRSNGSRGHDAGARADCPRRRTPPTPAHHRARAPPTLPNGSPRSAGWVNNNGPPSFRDASGSTPPAAAGPDVLDPDRPQHLPRASAGCTTAIRPLPRGRDRPAPIVSVSFPTRRSAPFPGADGRTRTAKARRRGPHLRARWPSSTAPRGIRVNAVALGSIATPAR